MIERDDHIPPLPELLAELDRARAIANTHVSAVFSEETMRSDEHIFAGQGPSLLSLQTNWVACVLQDPQPEDAPMRLALAETVNDTPAQRFGIYHRAYRLRLCEVLRDSFAKTCAYMGSDSFDAQASVFVTQQPSTERNLARYGATLPAFFQHNPELYELAQLDWDLRSRFDGADAPALTAEALVPDTQGEIPCLRMDAPLHPSVLLRDNRTNALKLWRDIDDDVEVPEVQHLKCNSGLVVWRWDLQPHFMSLDAAQYRFLQALAAGASIQDASERFADTEVLPSPEVLGAWLQSWLNQGLLRTLENS
jgi:hypothetical protein